MRVSKSGREFGKEILWSFFKRRYVMRRVSMCVVGALIVVWVIGSVQATTVEYLTNGDFESWYDAGSGNMEPTGWQVEPGGGSGLDASQGDDHTGDGNYSMKLTGSPYNEWHYYSQTVNALPDSQYTVEGYVECLPSQGSAYAEVVVLEYNSSGDRVATHYIKNTYGWDTSDRPWWVKHIGSFTTTSNTASMELRLMFKQRSSDNSGYVLYDDFSLTGPPIPEPATI